MVCVCTGPPEKGEAWSEDVDKERHSKINVYFSGRTTKDRAPSSQTLVVHSFLRPFLLLLRETEKNESSLNGRAMTKKKSYMAIKPEGGGVRP